MQFNPADKSISLIADIDFLLYGKGNTFNPAYSIEDRTRNINTAWDEAVAELYKADPNHKWDDTTNADLPFATLNLVANQDHYTLLDSALVIHRIRMKAPSGDWITLTPKLRSELTDSELASTGNPSSYYKIGGVIFPVPVPTYGATLGVELEFQRGANHFLITDTSKEAGFNPMFHQVLSVSAALRYAVSNGLTDKALILSQQKAAIVSAMREHYERRSPDEKPKLRLKRPSVAKYGL